MFSTYEEAVDYIMNIPRFTSKNEPDKTRAFLNKLGDVSFKIPTIHIAGTNGKGSVCAYLRAGFNEAGLSCGCFTSPHLVDIRERFTIDDKMIEEREFLNVCNFVYDEVMDFRGEEGNVGYHPTFFEFLFFVGVVWFKQKRPDVLVLETGLGGRLDATNSIQSPDVCVITEIGLDHMEYLGETKDLIAGEKAGIIKDGVPVCFVDRNESWTKVLLDAAKLHESPCEIVNAANINNFERSPEGIDFSYVSRYDENAIFRVKTKALYQIENVLLAFTAIGMLQEKLGLNIDMATVRKGFTKMVWPGRMEEIKKGLILDGAHNEDGIDAFIKSVSEDGASSRSLLYSAVSDKQVESVAAKLISSKLFKKIYVVHLDSYRACDMDRLRKCFAMAKEASFHESTKEGLMALLEDDCSLKYVVGSLYLVGEVKSIIKTESET